MQKEKIIETFQKYLATNHINLTYMERFLGGMSNYTYHVVVNNKDYVIRIANKDGKQFVNYPTEKLHLFLLEPYEITSKTLFYDTETGHKISEYLPGNNLTTTLTHDDFVGVASALRRLHSLPIEGVDYAKKERLDRYEKDVKDVLSDDYFALKRYWISEFNAHYARFSVVFTHGDAQRSNIVKDDKNYTLVDFEFSGLNDPFYDIASFGNIDFNDSLTLLDYYLGHKALPHEKRRVMFYRFFQVLQWHVVALVKHLNKQSEKLHIDFKKYSDNYLSFAKTLAEKIKALPIE